MRWLYRRRLAAPEMTLVFTALNIGLFAAITSIGAGHFPTGIGFGLFGLLSLVRLPRVPSRGCGAVAQRDIKCTAVDLARRASA